MHGTKKSCISVKTLIMKHFYQKKGVRTFSRTDNTQNQNIDDNFFFSVMLGYESSARTQKFLLGVSTQLLYKSFFFFNINIVMSYCFFYIYDCKGRWIIKMKPYQIKHKLTWFMNYRMLLSIVLYLISIMLERYLEMFNFLIFFC